MNKLLVKLGLKCSCGGWRTFFKKYKVHVADIELADGSWEAAYVKFRPCKRCGFAIRKVPMIRLQQGGNYTTPPGSELRVRIDT